MSFCKRPVSYTHLDVYKRQDEGQEDYDPAEASIMKWGSYTKNNNDW